MSGATSRHALAAHTSAAGTPPRRQPALLVGALLTGLLLATALLSLVWTPHPPAQQFVRARLAPPSANHWLGTDAYGHDVLSQLMVGAQSAVLVGVVAVAIGMVFGVLLGLLAAARKGWVEELIMRAADLTFAFPAILMAIMLRAVYGSGVVISIVAIGIASIPVFARITRATANALWQRDFVTAARACGRGPWAITREHILPNLMPILIVQATIQFAIAILAEAALSYLGLGTQYPTPSWGRMLSEAQSLLAMAPLLALFPGLAIALSVFGLNLLGDGLRDRLDPKLREIRT
ncbi:peptide ABC transporter permease [Lampropedia cohaerens]|uniref:Peptide ABC transporter permease n=1 Tax=Lampropedia cohaerens TaxID=1610491 RepID=A0A0U1Q2P3_9BURK|nr:ABC transporter permease [Lampropedia cohaerens]KKW69038.1 peptide ABC transporter permease [Lampropedia cohaerens]